MDQAHAGSMRLLVSIVVACAAVGCSEVHDHDAGAAPPDAGPAPTDAGFDAGFDAGPCSCRTGSYSVTGMGDGFTVDYDLELVECDGSLVCEVDGTERRCFDQRPGRACRVYLDTDGYVQLIFDHTSCAEPWTGSYATHGGSASLTATRIE